MHVTTDFEIALETEAGAGAGVVLIAGTGSSAYGRNAAGQTARAGGHGPWVGDEGSAYDIGRRAVAAAARASDAAGKSSEFAEAILRALECPAWGELIERIAAHPDDVFPRVFPVVVEAAGAGHAAARQLLLEAALSLAAIARAVVRKLSLGEQEFVLVKTGGVFGRSRWLDDTLDSILREAAPRARITLLRTAPAIGAARLAQRLAASRTPPHGR